MSEKTITVNDDNDKDREKESRHEPSRRLLVLRGGRLVEIASRPRREAR